MSEITWTKAELNEFDCLVDEQTSRIQTVRIKGRLDMQKFIEKHGKEKCDAMWAHLQELEKKRGR